MLERLVTAVGAGHVDQTVLIASAYATHKDQFPGLAITVLAEWEAGKKPLGRMTELTLLIQRRIGRRVTLQIGDVTSALLWWLSPECEACHGLGHIALPDAPMLEDAACEVCGGHGKRAHLSNSRGYAASLAMLDSTWDWARRVGERMPMAYDARIMTEVA